jgi:hypothetical protein
VDFTNLKGDRISSIDRFLVFELLGPTEKKPLGRGFSGPDIIVIIIARARSLYLYLV